MVNLRGSNRSNTEGESVAIHTELDLVGTWTDLRVDPTCGAFGANVCLK